MPKKILPRKFWRSDEEVMNISRKEFLNRLKTFGEEQNIPNISWKGVDILRFFLSIKTPKSVLEIGCANGFSSIVIADYLEKWGGKLLTCDVSEPSVESAKANFKAANINNIRIKTGNALEIIDKNDGLFDFIFIDGQKSWTHKFFDYFKDFLTPNGIVIVDDTKKFPDKMKSFKNYINREKEKWIFFQAEDSKDDAMMVFSRR